MIRPLPKIDANDYMLHKADKSDSRKWVASAHGRVPFDDKMRPRGVEHSNALAVMRAVDLERRPFGRGVPLTRRPSQTSGSRRDQQPGRSRTVSANSSRDRDAAETQDMRCRSGMNVRVGFSRGRLARPRQG